MAKLIYSDGGTDLEFALDPGRAAYTVGRNPMCDLRINNPSISRKHAEIRLDAVTGKYSVYDLNSSNGTYVNGKREQQGELGDGDEVMCGEFKLFFHTGDGPLRRPSPSGAPPPPPPPPPPRHSKTLAAKPGDLFAASGDMKAIQQLSSSNSEQTMKVSAEIFQDTFSPESEEIAAPVPAAQPNESVAPGSSDAERELKAAKAELKSLRMALQNETGRAAEASQEKAKLAKEVQRLQDDLATANAPTEDDSAGRVGELEAELEKRDAQIAELEKAGAEIEQLKGELAAANKKALAAKADAAKAAGSRDKAKAEAQRGDDGEAKRLKADLRKRGAELDTVKAELAKRESEIETLKSEVQRMRSLEGELEVARSQIEELQTGASTGDLDALQAKNAAMKEAFKDLSSELKDLVSSNRELATELSQLKK